MSNMLPMFDTAYCGYCTSIMTSSRPYLKMFSFRHVVIPYYKSKGIVVAVHAIKAYGGLEV